MRAFKGKCFDECSDTCSLLLGEVAAYESSLESPAPTGKPHFERRIALLPTLDLPLSFQQLVIRGTRPSLFLSSSPFQRCPIARRARGHTRDTLSPQFAHRDFVTKRERTLLVMPQ